MTASTGQIDERRGDGHPQSASANSGEARPSFRGHSVSRAGHSAAQRAAQGATVIPHPRPSRQPSEESASALDFKESEVRHAARGGLSDGLYDDDAWQRRREAFRHRAAIIVLDVIEFVYWATLAGFIVMTIWNIGANH